MVDFPEGYGFAPNHGARIMQESFLVDIGVFERRERGGWVQAGRRMNRSPYEFHPIGFIRKENNETPLRGTMFMDGTMDVGTPIEGTLQQVVTAMCTIHRIRRGIK